jgi:hypothetical protein
MTGPSYTIYHARDWAEGKSIAELEQEIARMKHKAQTHHYAWNEVGNTSDDWTRHDTLVEILATRKGVAVSGN